MITGRCRKGNHQACRKLKCKCDCHARNASNKNDFEEWKKQEKIKKHKKIKCQNKNAIKS